MIRKIKFRFALIATLAVFVVLVIIVGGTNTINYQTVSRSADEIIEILAYNNGAFGDLPTDEPTEEFSPELQYETRFFTVEIFADGTYRTNVSQIAAVNEEIALNLTNEVIFYGGEEGYIETYRYKIFTDEDSTLVIFVDWGKQLKIVENFIIVSIAASFFALILVFIISFVLSNRVLAPIIKGYEKQSRFIANASHEIKTPLTIISANNEIMEIEHGESESSKAINKQINKLNQMVNSLTLLTKIENLNKKAKPFNVSNLLLDTVFEYNLLLEKYKVNLNISENVMYKGNKGLIHQLFSILLDNAIKYGLTFIEISLSIKSNKIEITMVNDAYEVENGNLNKYFERFYRSSDVRNNKIEGNGIGLSIASEIVEVHNGTIKAFGENNEFTIKIIL